MNPATMNNSEKRMFFRKSYHFPHILNDAWVVNLKTATNKRSKMFRFFRRKRDLEDLNELGKLSAKVSTLEYKIRDAQDAIDMNRVNMEVLTLVSRNVRDHKLMDTHSMYRTRSEVSKLQDEGYYIYKTYTDGRFELWLKKVDMDGVNA